MKHILSKHGPWRGHQRKALLKMKPPVEAAHAGPRGYPLRLALPGDWVRIVRISGRLNLHNRLAGMGLWVGSTLQVIHNSRNGKLLLGHGGTRLYLGGGIAHRIQVVAVAVLKGAVQ